MRRHLVMAHERRGLNFNTTVKQHVRGKEDPRDIMIRADQRAEREVREKAAYALAVWDQAPESWPGNTDRVAHDLAEQVAPGPLQDRVRRQIMRGLDERFDRVKEA